MRLLSCGIAWTSSLRLVNRIISASAPRATPSQDLVLCILRRGALSGRAPRHLENRRRCSSQTTQHLASPACLVAYGLRTTVRGNAKSASRKARGRTGLAGCACLLSRPPRWSFLDRCDCRAEERIHALAVAEHSSNVRVENDHHNVTIEPACESIRFGFLVVEPIFSSEPVAGSTSSPSGGFGLRSLRVHDVWSRER